MAPQLSVIVSATLGALAYVVAVYLIDRALRGETRNERWDRYKGVAHAITALSLVSFAWVVRRVKSMWIALCLGQIFIMLMAQLLSYYYAFLVIAAPLTKAKRQLGVPYLGLAAVSQLIWGAFGDFDDRSAAVTLVTLVFCYGLVCTFAEQGSIARLFGRAPKRA